MSSARSPAHDRTSPISSGSMSPCRAHALSTSAMAKIAVGARRDRWGFWFRILGRILESPAARHAAVLGDEHAIRIAYDAVAADQDFAHGLGREEAVAVRTRDREPNALFHTSRGCAAVEQVAERRCEVDRLRRGID